VPGTGAQTVTMSFTMSLESGGAGDDQFAWQIGGADDQALGALWLDTRSGELSLVESDGTRHTSIQHVTSGGGAHRFEITYDAEASTWSATIDGVMISEKPAKLAQGAAFKEIFGVWDVGVDGQASGAAVMVSDFTMSAD